MQLVRARSIAFWNSWVYFGHRSWTGIGNSRWRCLRWDQNYIALWYVCATEFVNIRTADRAWRIVFVEFYLILPLVQYCSRGDLCLSFHIFCGQIFLESSANLTVWSFLRLLRLSLYTAYPNNDPIWWCFFDQLILFSFFSTLSCKFIEFCGLFYWIGVVSLLNRFHSTWFFDFPIHMHNCLKLFLTQCFTSVFGSSVSRMFSIWYSFAFSWTNIINFYLLYLFWIIHYK